MDAKDLRVSDAEREHVGRLLQRAVGQGMLSLGEFTERMDTALAAKTRGELNSVLVDLPGLQIADSELPRPSVQPVSQPNPVAAGAIGTGGDATTIRGTMSNVTRKGPWQVPSQLSVVSKMSNVTLDFTDAQVGTPVVEIWVDDYCSTLSLLVPDQMTVDLNGLETMGGTATNKVRTGPPQGRVHLVVRGKTRFGSVIVKHPFGVRWKRMTS